MKATLRNHRYLYFSISVTCSKFYRCAFALDNSSKPSGSEVNFLLVNGGGGSDLVTGKGDSEGF